MAKSKFDTDKSQKAPKVNGKPETEQHDKKMKASGEYTKGARGTTGQDMRRSRDKVRSFNGQ
jgi:hypothetical protein